MDFHAITPGRPPELLMRVVAGSLEIIPPPVPTRQLDQFVMPTRLPPENGWQLG
jgi:hypothetical protein